MPIEADAHKKYVPSQGERADAQKLICCPACARPRYPTYADKMRAMRAKIAGNSCCSCNGDQSVQANLYSTYKCTPPS